MSLNNIEEISFCIHQNAPKIHCLTNPVTMQDVANLLLAAGGSAVMGQDEQEVEEITSFCHGTLLNTGVPDIAKIQACILAGQKANALGHPVVLDPVGAGASTFRRKELQKLLQAVHLTAVRCNQEEAVVLCSLLSDTDSPEKHGGVESSLQMAERDVCLIAEQAASLLNCTVLITGKEDVVSDGKQTQILTGGDSRIRRITGGGCMLSALCTLFLCTDTSAFDAVRAAGALWRETALEAGRRTDAEKSGIGSFHVHLFDVLPDRRPLQPSLLGFLDAIGDDVLGTIGGQRRAQCLRPRQQDAVAPQGLDVLLIELVGIQVGQPQRLRKVPEADVFQLLQGNFPLVEPCPQLVIEAHVGLDVLLGLRDAVGTVHLSQRQALGLVEVE